MTPARTIKTINTKTTQTTMMITVDEPPSSSGFPVVLDGGPGLLGRRVEGMGRGLGGYVGFVAFVGGGPGGAGGAGGLSSGVVVVVGEPKT